MRASLALAPALALVLTGCLQPAPSATTAALGPAGDLVAALKAAPAPGLDGKANLAWLQKFVTDHKPRVSGTAGEKAAGDDLAAQLKALGYEVEDHTYAARGLPLPAKPERAIVGVKKGATMPDHYIFIGGHYDTAPVGRATIDLPKPLPESPAGAPPADAAYDNGSGTAMVMELARLLANATTQRSLAFVLFNGEEELGTSGDFARDLVTRGVKVDAYLGNDMVGINWPSTAGCLCMYSGEKDAATFHGIQEKIAKDVLGYPVADNAIEIYDSIKTRSSDERSFEVAGFPIMRFAGLRLAVDYWGYHKTNDTMATMMKQAGGDAPLQQGFEAMAAVEYYNVLALDAAAPSK